MSDAFVYMFVVGSGASSGVAVVGFASYRLFMFMQRRGASRASGKTKKKRSVV